MIIGLRDFWISVFREAQHGELPVIEGQILQLEQDEKKFT